MTRDLRILFLGQNWYGSCARACCYALRRLGYDVHDIDDQRFFPRPRGLFARGTFRALRPMLVSEYNQAILVAARHFQPDIMLAFKGTYVLAETVSLLRERGIVCYNFFPDGSPFSHGPYLPNALTEYDCVFFTKPFLDKELRERLGVADLHLIRHGYDADIHRPTSLSNRDLESYGSDVTFIGTYTSRKEWWLSQLVHAMPRLGLRIWGNGWAERCTLTELKRHIMGTAVEGTSYAKAIAASRVNLAIMTERAPAGSDGEETTTRTFEIPACGGFMLHERSDELSELFVENEEVVAFDSIDELAGKLRHYLADEERRVHIASRGRERCVPAYSYDSRMGELLEYHHVRKGLYPTLSVSDGAVQR